GEAANDSVFALGRQADGKIVVGGNFTRFAESGCGRIARLNADGTVDAGFKSGLGANGAILDLLILKGGRILIAGSFTTFDGMACNRMAKLNGNGEIESDFKADPISKGEVRSIAILNGGKVLAGGAFNSVAGLTRNGVARLNPDGSLDQR